MNTIKDAIKKVTDNIAASETVKDLTSFAKGTGAVDLVRNAFKDDKYYEIKKTILKKIREYDTIIIHRHVHPDGDCLGSAYGLRDMLRTSYPKKNVYAVGDDSVEYLTFLGSDDVVSDETYENSLVIVVDTSTSARVSNKRFTLGKEVIKIDHHIETDPFGTLNYVREEMPSTSTILIDFFETFKGELDLSTHGAQCLYLATVTDTGRFRYSSVTGDTLRLAGLMLDYDFDAEKMYSYLNLKSKESLKLQGYVYNNFNVSPNGVAYIYLSKKIQKKFKVSVDDASALVNCLDSIKGSLIWILFVEFDDVIRARLRSRFTTVDKIANQFSGGGHLRASGAVCKSKKDIKRMVEVADKQLAQFKLDNKDLF